ncbi:carboxylating nicotinate-nucleotide diphosphorylase [uncultured Arcticibacterium sp.]|uniref:carboxylating nicotinate-nucleotide diphosphorylase n=1 Tax=uncultured Arcticibacterium sp. TaxID=2173042 RepID=UPI0030F62D44
MEIKPEEVKAFIQAALREDVGDGDHTSLSTVPANAQGKAKLLVKDDGILAGIELAKAIFKEVDPELELEILLNDGDEIKYGDIAFYVTGKDQSILTAERLVLNCMQRMSGIATTTKAIVKKLEGTKCKVLDTRKTTPNFRLPEKWAVKIGGGVNHRTGLYDMILIKDNHVDYAGGIKNAMLSAQKYLKDTGRDLPIEVEVRDFKELEEVLEIGGVVRIMLDNFNYIDTRKAIAIIDGRFPVESSGGITPETIRSYADCGIDYASMGYLTHSIKSLDLSLKAVK